MKHLILIPAVLFFLASNAQSPKEEHLQHRFGLMKSMMNDLDAKQIAELQTKRMTFLLDLNKEQSEKVYNIILKRAEKRKEEFAARQNKEKMEKPDNKEIYNRMINRLNDMITLKKQMATILNGKQMEIWMESAAKRPMLLGFGKKPFDKMHRAN